MDGFAPGPSQTGIRTWGHVAGLLAVLWLGRLAAADDLAPLDPTLPAKSRCQVAIDKLHPTQFAVGYWEVDRRAAHIPHKSPAKLKAYLEAHPVLAVIGPGGQPYLVDGHHLCLALLKNGMAKTVEVRVEANWRGLTQADFWRKMQEHGWVYLYDHKGRGPLDPDKLPHKVTELADDPYRSLAWEVRKRGGYGKTTASFAEFQWAAYFRPRVAIGSSQADFERAAEAALKICHSPEAKGLPGYSP
jgi:hypothetical protein